MSEKIEPALTPELVAIVSRRYVQQHELYRAGFEERLLPHDDAVAIAVLNHRLADSDPRKITREKVNRLRAIAEAIRDVHGNWDAKAFLEETADTLESYLPPER